MARGSGVTEGQLECDTCKPAVDETFLKLYGVSTDGPTEDGLRIGMLNADGMLNKLDVIKGLIHVHKFDIFVVVESKLLKREVEMVTIDGYEKEPFNRSPASKGGGLLVYWKKGFDVKIDTFQEDLDAQYQCLPVTFTKPLELDLVAVYNPQSKNKKDFVDWLLTHLSSKRGSRNMIILGDFNIDISNRNKSNQPLVDRIKSLEVSQMVTKPTRVRGSESSLIDHVYVDNSLLNGFEVRVLRTAASDHDVVYFTIPSEKLKPAATHHTRNPPCIELVGILYTTYSTPAVPADIMREALDKLTVVKCDAMKSRASLEGKWRDCSKARNLYAPVKRQSETTVSYSNVIADYSRVAILLQPPIQKPETHVRMEEPITAEEVKHALKWFLESYRVSVGNLASVQDIENCVQSLNNVRLKQLIDEYKRFKAMSEYTLSTCQLVDYIIATRMMGKYGVELKSHANVLKSLHEKLEGDVNDVTSVVACFYKKEQWEELEKKYSRAESLKCKHDKEHVSLITQTWLAQLAQDLSKTSNVKSFSCGNELVICITVGQKSMPITGLQNYFKGGLPTEAAIFANDKSRTDIEEQIKRTTYTLVRQPIKCFGVTFDGRNTQIEDNNAILDCISRINKVSPQFKKQSKNLHLVIEKFTLFKCKWPMKTGPKCVDLVLNTKEALDDHHKENHAVCQYCGQIYSRHTQAFRKHEIECDEGNDITLYLTHC